MDCKELSNSLHLGQVELVRHSLCPCTVIWESHMGELQRESLQEICQRESLHRVLTPDFCTVGCRVAMPAYVSALHGDKVCMIVCEKF